MVARALKVLVLAVALASPTSAQAHRGTEIAPALGLYAPTGRLPILGAIALICIPDANDQCPSLVLSAKPAAAFGGRVTGWLSNREAIEGSLWYSPSGVNHRANSIVMANLRFVLSLAPLAHTSALLMGGPAVIHRDSDPTSIGASWGIALDVRSLRTFRLRPEVEHYLYSISGKFQNDFVFSLSTGFAGGKRGADRR